MTVRYVAVCDGCGAETGHERFDGWGQLKVREPGRAVELMRSYDFCSAACLDDWWCRVADAVRAVPTDPGDQP